MAVIVKFPKCIPHAANAAQHSHGSLALSIPAASAQPTPLSPQVPNLEERKTAYRRDMLAKIHIAAAYLIKNKPGYTEYIYRATLEELYEVKSAAELKPDQMHDLLLHFARLGWRKCSRKGAGKAPNAYYKDTSGLSREALMGKLEAMLTEKGKAEGTTVPWNYAVGILKRQSQGVTRSLDHATREQLASIIAALYRDAKRLGRRVR